MKRKGFAQWAGGLQDGTGHISTDSGVLHQIPYSFSTRFEETPGTNPEELIAAAHASCFSMALSAQLGKAGFKPNNITTTATVSLEKSPEGFSIPAIHLDVKASIPQIDQGKFHAIAEEAKAGCPVSKLMKATITMDAHLD